jgi:fatty-acyl-CoA synthase
MTLALVQPEKAHRADPDKFVYVGEIPKTRVGKFDKKVLRKRHAKGELG